MNEREQMDEDIAEITGELPDVVDETVAMAAIRAAYLRGYLIAVGEIAAIVLVVHLVLVASWGT